MNNNAPHLCRWLTGALSTLVATGSSWEMYARVYGEGGGPLVLVEVDGQDAIVRKPACPHFCLRGLSAAWSLPCPPRSQVPQLETTREARVNRSAAGTEAHRGSRSSRSALSKGRSKNVNNLKT